MVSSRICTLVQKGRTDQEKERIGTETQNLKRKCPHASEFLPSSFPRLQPPRRGDPTAGAREPPRPTWLSSPAHELQEYPAHSRLSADFCPSEYTFRTKEGCWHNHSGCNPTTDLTEVTRAHEGNVPVRVWGPAAPGSRLSVLTLGDRPTP